MKDDKSLSYEDDLIYSNQKDLITNEESTEQETEYAKPDIEEDYNIKIITTLNNISNTLHILVDSWVPVINRYSDACDKIDSMKTNIFLVMDLLNRQSKELDSLKMNT